MPWNEVTPMDEKSLFIADVLRGVLTISEICERYNISRNTGYKLIHRPGEEGPAALLERSRKPLSCPHRTPSVIEARIVEIRRRHPKWGAKNLRHFDAQRLGHAPATSP